MTWLDQEQLALLYRSINFVVVWWATRDVNAIRGSSSNNNHIYIAPLSVINQNLSALQCMSCLHTAFPCQEDELSALHGKIKSQSDKETKHEDRAVMWHNSAQYGGSQFFLGKMFSGHQAPFNNRLQIQILSFVVQSIHRGIRAKKLKQDWNITLLKQVFTKRYLDAGQFIGENGEWCEITDRNTTSK